MAAALHVSSCSHSKGWFPPGSLLPEAAAYITSPWWLALLRTWKLALGSRAAVLRILSRRLHLHLTTEGFPLPPHGVAQWYRLGAETGVNMALVRHLNFLSFPEVRGDEAAIWPQKCHTYGLATRCDPQRHSWAGVCLKTAALMIAFLHSLCQFSHPKSVGSVTLKILSTMFQLWF